MSEFQQLAAKRWPRSAARRRIFGDGAFALIIMCQFPGKILLFPTAAARLRKLEQLDRGCCGDCTSDHKVAELVLEEQHA